MRKAVPEMRFAVQRGRGWAKVISDTGSMQAGIGGIDIKSEPEFKKVLQHHRAATSTTWPSPTPSCCSRSRLEKLGVKVGDALTISAPRPPAGTNNTIDVRVVAIAKDVGLLSTWNCFVPDRDACARCTSCAPTPPASSRSMLKRGQAGRHRPAWPAACASRWRQAGYRVMEPDPRAFWMKFETVNREDWTGQKLDVTTWEDEMSFMSGRCRRCRG